MKIKDTTEWSERGDPFRPVGCPEQSDRSSIDVIDE